MEFFRKYYAPNNASLSIAGDIDVAATRALVEKYFGEVKRGAFVEPVAPPAAFLTGVKQRTLTDKVQLPRLYLAWLTPPLLAPGDAALDAAASVLAGGKNSRLYKRLVYDLQIAQDVSAAQGSQALASVFGIVVTPRPGHTLEEVQRVVDEELDKLRESPPSARELDRVVNQTEASFYARMEQVGGFGGKGDQLNAYYTQTGNPDYFAEDLARYRALSPSDVQAAVRQFLPKDRRVELRVVPEKTSELAAGLPVHVVTCSLLRTPSALLVLLLGAVSAFAQAPDRTKVPVPGPAPALRLPEIQKRALSNGLPVWIVELHKVPVVQVSLVVLAGGSADPSGKLGVASMTSAMLDEGAGSRERPRDSRRRRLSRRDAEHDGQLRFVGRQALGADRTPGRGAAGDGRRGPPAVVPRRRAGAAAQGTADLDAPGSRRRRVDCRPLVPEDRLRTGTATAPRLPGRQPPSAASRWTIFAPSTGPITGPIDAALIVVGDVTTDAAVAQLEAAFGAWKAEGPAVPGAALADAPQVDARHVYLIDKPGAPQSQICIGGVGVAAFDARTTSRCR